MWCKFVFLKHCKSLPVGVGLWAHDSWHGVTYGAEGSAALNCWEIALMFRFRLVGLSQTLTVVDVFFFVSLPGILFYKLAKRSWDFSGKGHESGPWYKEAGEQRCDASDVNCLRPRQSCSCGSGWTAATEEDDDSFIFREDVEMFEKATHNKAELESLHTRGSHERILP